MPKTKTPPKPKQTKYPRENFQVEAGKTEYESQLNISKIIASPELAAGRVIIAAEGQSSIDKPSMLEELKRQSEAIQGGDMAQTEAMLANQAVALQTLFSRLTESAMNSKYLSHMETWLKLALRAQSQSRATLEALSQIKNPPIVYAKQANFAQGHQQVNNGVSPHYRTREIENRPNQLSEVSNELRKDTRAPSHAGKNDSSMEAVGKVHGAEDQRR